MLTISPVKYVTPKHTALYHNQEILYNTSPSYSFVSGALLSKTNDNKTCMREYYTTFRWITSMYYAVKYKLLLPFSGKSVLKHFQFLLFDQTQAWPLTCPSHASMVYQDTSCCLATLEKKTAGSVPSRRMSSSTGTCSLDCFSSVKYDYHTFLSENLVLHVHQDNIL